MSDYLPVFIEILFLGRRSDFPRWWCEKKVNFIPIEKPLNDNLPYFLSLWFVAPWSDRPKWPWHWETQTLVSTSVYKWPVPLGSQLMCAPVWRTWEGPEPCHSLSTKDKTRMFKMQSNIVKYSTNSLSQKTCGFLGAMRTNPDYTFRFSVGFLVLLAGISFASRPYICAPL